MSVVRARASTTRVWRAGRAPTVLCLDGRFSLRARRGELAVSPGDAAFVAAGVGSVDVVGAGVLVSVTSPVTLPARV